MTFRVIGPDAHLVQADKIEVLRPPASMTDEQFAELARTILVAIPHRPSEGINAAIASAIGIWARLGTPVATIADPFGGMVELTRAGIVRTFLEYVGSRPQIERIVLMDNDQDVRWDAPYLLAAWGRPIVSGVVCSFSPSKGGVFACFTLKDRHGVSRFPSVKNTKAMPAKGLVEVEHAGSGLICIHRDVFRAILAAGEDPFLIPEEVRRHCARTGTLKLGEDMSFCEQARRCGFQIHVDLSVRAPHHKSLAVSWPEELIAHDLDSRVWDVSPLDKAPGE